MSLRQVYHVAVQCSYYLFCINVPGFLNCSACEKEGTAEKAGKDIDRALDSAKKKYDEATK